VHLGGLPLSATPEPIALPIAPVRNWNLRETPPKVRMYLFELFAEI